MVEIINEMLKEKMIGEKTIYALRGFNSIIKRIDLQLNRIFYTGIEDDILNIEKLDSTKMLSDNIYKLSSNSSYYCFYEELVLLEKMSLLGIVKQFKIVVIDIGCFNYFYPGFLTENAEDSLKAFDQDTVEINNIQKIYSSYNLRNNNPIISYNQLDNQEDVEFINLFTSYSKTFQIWKNEKVKSIELYDNSTPEVLVDVFNGAFFNHYNTIIYNSLEGKDDRYLKKYLHILNVIGLNITLKEEKKEYLKPLLYEEYLSILKRKNPMYDFKNIKMYEDPFRSNKKTDLNQSIIIDCIYNNVINALQGKGFRDIFVTAPTGAGKSILFQIPAILSAEKHNLMTIVISPLIGLMKDQVDNLKKITNLSATINSEYTPFEKEAIKEKIKNGEISILYISPETLLGNADINTFIGDRKIGLLVVDEAHTVATWGKNFRPDYWYLGDYLNKLRHTSSHVFPIATFTATATISNGIDDMYHDIIESLNMTPVSFFGDVKRTNINFNIKTHKVDHAYAEEKERIVSESIENFLNTDDKTLVYFPYVRFLNEFYEKFSNKKIGRFYGNLDKSDKDESLADMKSGKINVVLATKAFGMGIDISDIKNVYHFAPTGNLSDYVQEIGRAAREPDMIGIASTDYYEKDFRYINQLHGMSQITNYNIKGVLQKIDYKYRKAGKRNFLVSVDDFSHIFNANDDSEIESKLKATIIAIKKDFKSMINYVPLIFKPRSMFTKGLFFIPDSKLQLVKDFGWSAYITKKYDREFLSKTSRKGITNHYLGDVYELDFKNCWEEKYNGKFDGYSFGNFKRMFYESELPRIQGIQIKDCFFDRMLLTIETKNGNLFQSATANAINFLNNLKHLLDEMKISNKHYNVYEIAKMYNEKYKSHFSTTKLHNIMEPLINLLISYNSNLPFGNSKFCEYNSKTDRYHVVSSNYSRIIREFIDAINSHFEGYSDKKERICIIDSNNKNKNKQMRNDALLVSIQILELLDLAHYSFQAGNKPEFFVRINSEKVILNVLEDKFYSSRTLGAIKQLHLDSVSYMKHFFEKLNSNEERWQFIEDYFLGVVESKYKIEKEMKVGIKTIDEPIVETESAERIKEIPVYSIFHGEDDITCKYYISKLEIHELKNYVKLSPDCEVAINLKKHSIGEVFNINGYEYLIENLEFFEIKKDINYK